jgi:hypothetical protein
MRPDFVGVTRSSEVLKGAERDDVETSSTTLSRCSVSSQRRGVGWGSFTEPRSAIKKLLS